MERPIANRKQTPIATADTEISAEEMRWQKTELHMPMPCRFCGGSGGNVHDGLCYRCGGLGVE